MPHNAEFPITHGAHVHKVHKHDVRKQKYPSACRFRAHVHITMLKCGHTPPDRDSLCSVPLQHPSITAIAWGSRPPPPAALTYVRLWVHHTSTSAITYPLRLDSLMHM